MKNHIKSLIHKVVDKRIEEMEEFGLRSNSIIKKEIFKSLKIALIEKRISEKDLKNFLNDTE